VNRNLVVHNRRTDDSISVIYRVDAIKRTNVPNHLRTLEDLEALDRVLANDSCRGWFNRLVSKDDTRPPDLNVPVHSLPTVLAKSKHFFKNVCLPVDYYLRQYVTDDASAFVGWSGMSPFTLERANELGLETFLIRASSHIAESRRMSKLESERFGVENPFSRGSTRHLGATSTNWQTTLSHLPSTQPGVSSGTGSIRTRYTSSPMSAISAG
jgi:hypothetical protein